MLLLLAWGVLLSTLSNVLVQLVYMCKGILLNVCLEKLFSKNSHHTETSQPICFANHLTGFLTMRILTERYFRTEFRLLLTVTSYSQMTYNLIIMGCVFQNKLVYQKQSSKYFHQISIFQVIDNSQGVIWDSRKILKK